MNFLELCKAVARESGTIAGLPSFTTLTDASGRLDKLVNWVRDAWVDIQTERNDWLFRIGTFEDALVVGEKEYTAADLGLTDVARWLPDTRERFNMTLYDPDIGQSDESYIPQKLWSIWRTTYDRGTHDNNRPIMWAASPDGNLCVGPAPDKAYVIRGEYRKTAQRLEVDADEPIIPEDYHMVIVAKALDLMAESDEAYEALVAKARRYDLLRSQLVRDQTPEVYEFSGPTMGN